MADTHGAPVDPNAAPMHHDIRERFAPIQVAICAMLGVGAITGGIIAGLIALNR